MNNTLEGALPAPAHGPAPTPPTIRHVVFPTDLSPECDRAFEHARLLAATLGARLTLYHALAAPSGEAPPGREALAAAEAGALARLESQARGLAGAAQVVVERHATPELALVAFIRSTRPDLVVMATHARAGLAHLFLGSVMETVVQHGRTPVLCVCQALHASPRPYRRLLVPTDLSPGSRRAFAPAAQLARAFGAEVVVLHVARTAVPDPATGAAPSTAPIPSEEELRRFVEPDFEGVPLTPRVVVGTAWDRIVDAAGIDGADLIVMSTHGQDSLVDCLLGSHAERVVRHSPCPVLIA